MRRACPVAYSQFLGWSLFRHEDVLRVLNDPQTFSSEVSSHLSVPSGIDPPAHTGYRRVLDPYFSPEAMAAFAPSCQAIASKLVGRLQGPVEVMQHLAHPFALEVQCAFMGWPETLQAELGQWVKRNQEATLAGDRFTLNSLASQFTALVLDQAEQRRRNPAIQDVTARLVREQFEGRALEPEELTSIIRNWTVGELGTIAAAVGILMHALGQDGPLQNQLRRNPELAEVASEEILRVQGPLLSNRRKVTGEVSVGGRCLKPGDKVTLMWASANRDEAAFPQAQEIRLERDQSRNLVYGAGIHACPGAPLARLELRILMQTLLAASSHWGVLESHPARFPAGGFESLMVEFA